MVQIFLDRGRGEREARLAYRVTGLYGCDDGTVQDSPWRTGALRDKETHEYVLYNFCTLPT